MTSCYHAQGNKRRTTGQHDASHAAEPACQRNPAGRPKMFTSEAGWAIRKAILNVGNRPRVRAVYRQRHDERPAVRPSAKRPQEGSTLHLYARKTLVALLSFSVLGTVVTTAVFIGVGRRLLPKAKSEIIDDEDLFWRRAERRWHVDQMKACPLGMTRSGRYCVSRSGTLTRQRRRQDA